MSATGDPIPIHFMFSSMVGFSGTADRTALFTRFEQIQDGGHRHVGNISNVHISATGRPIHFMFCSRVGFSGAADLMALFSIRTNEKWRRLDNLEWSYLRNGYLYSAHCAVVFAIAQLSCYQRLLVLPVFCCLKQRCSIPLKCKAASFNLVRSVST